MAAHSQRDNLRGAAMMCVAMAAFTVNDTFMKLILRDLPFYQTLIVRAVIVGVLLIIWSRFTGGLDLRLQKRDSLVVFIRTCAEITATFFILTALTHMPLANATAILQSLPLTVALSGALFFREPLGWRRLAAIFVGFLGVLLIVRPGADFNVYALYALGGVAAVTVRDLASRQLSPHVSALPVSFYATIGNAVLGVAMFVFGGAQSQPWQSISGTQYLLLLVTSLCLVVAYIFAVNSMRTGALAVVTPFRYTAILFALVLGYVVFGDWPDSLTMFGAAIVVFSGIFTLYREQVAARLSKDSY